MGGMDTEVTLVRYSMFAVSDKKSSPYIEILAESHRSELGCTELDIALVNLLADKFNALPEREGKADVRTNVRAMKRLQKRPCGQRRSSVQTNELVSKCLNCLTMSHFS